MYKVYKNKKKKRNYKYITEEKSKSSERLEGLKNILSKRLYFMFVPHSKKKTITVSLSIFSIIILSVIICAALLVAFSYLTKNTVVANKVETLEGSYSNRLDEVSYFEDLFNSFVTNYNYRTNMIRLTKDAKNGESDYTNYADYTNAELIDKAAIINARAEEFESVKNYLEELKANINSKNKSLESIPSILPIDSRYAVISVPYQKNSLNSKGIGFETIAGTLVRSAAAGTVHSITYNNNDGFTIVVYHRLGIITTYRGLATSLVSENKDLKKGEIIGSAKTGILEYELTLATANANPLIFTSFN
ncbi:M23 family metallopeptidase [Brachyspira sp.]|uniref:M23 family metallopeptidase n=1 Tax=Brachyspira sp. TaxID=1977261 RepID=UPI003D7EEA21